MHGGVGGGVAIILHATSVPTRGRTRRARTRTRTPRDATQRSVVTVTPGQIQRSPKQKDRDPKQARAPLRSSLQSPPPRQPPRDTSLPLQAFVSRPDDVAGSSLGAGAGGWTSGGGWVAGWLGGAVAGMPAATATAASLRLPLPKAARHSPRSSRRHPDCRRRR